MYTFIFDIGKTNIKGQVLDDRGSPVWSRATRNRSEAGADYLQFDIDGIWNWLLQTLSEAAAGFSISAINVSTHGACAVLLDVAGELALPVMDYEFDGLVVQGENYSAVRPPFAQTLSPGLAAGLNLGRQLWWLKCRFPRQFEQVSAILMYPQFWTWKLTGIAVNEATSLGCHTDLWEPAAGRYSSLVRALDIERQLGSVVSAVSPVGSLSTELAQSLGLSASCRVYPGVHDSNASFARHLYCAPEERFTVISTGTWIVCMCNNGSLDALSDTRDMLANVSVLGQPIACARFMGGREFELISREAAQPGEAAACAADIEGLVKGGVFALPPFERGSGPFRHAGAAGGRIVGGEGSAALATLYLALMIDYELDLLRAGGTVLFGSIASKNPLLCALVAQLRPDLLLQSVDDAASTITGAWCLTRWRVPAPAGFGDRSAVKPTTITGLEAYRKEWRACVEV